MKPPAPTTKLLRIALESACDACGVSTEEVGQMSPNMNLRRGAACVTARMVYAMVAQTRIPKSRMCDRSLVLCKYLAPEAAYLWSSRGAANLSANTLVEVNPPPATATEEKVLEPMKQLVARAVDEYDRQVGSRQGIASPGTSERKTA